MFHPELAAAMAGYFLSHAPKKKLNDLLLMKLLLLAERKCLEETTTLISGARFVSMQNGPVLSEVLDLMRGRTCSPIWTDNIVFVQWTGTEGESNHCILKNEIPADEYLSVYQIGVLESVWSQHKTDNKWDTVNLTHEFGEWDESCAETKTSRAITFETIFLKGFGEPPEVARLRAADAEYYEKVCG